MKKAYEFALENRLQILDSDLHRRFSNIVFAMQYVLKRYETIFPDFTDHSVIHSINVIEFCNQIIGEQIDKMNADEIYVLLLACYFHDTGMGISKKDYDAFSKKIDFGDYFLTHDINDFRLRHANYTFVHFIIYIPPYL